MICIGSANALIGIGAGYGILHSGGSALDGVEAAIRLVEDNMDDHSVGTGGIPNLDGVVQLDASIMDGAARKSGAVAALEGYAHPISIARQVMERLPHVLLAGAGAAQFAAEIGAETRELLTGEALEAWNAKIREIPSWNASSGIERAAAVLTHIHSAGTVDVLALDREGRLASGVSTSGWPWKYPGRVGDSPCVGAGNYADARYGAAACTGFGELAIRASTARTVVLAMSNGASPEDACREAIGDAALLADPSLDVPLSIVALAPDGRYAAVSTMEGAMFAICEEGMPHGELRDRQIVPFAEQAR